MNWVFEHQSDPDFDTPYEAPSKKARVEQKQTPPVSFLVWKIKILYSLNYRLMKKMLL